MASDRRLEDSISTWLEATARGRIPGRVLDATFERTRGARQQVDWRTLLGVRSVPRFVPAVGAAAAVVVAAVLALNTGFVHGPGATPTPSATPPTAASPSVPPYCGGTIYAGQALLDCTSDGTILLIQKADGNLYVRHADGSETLVSGQFPGITGDARSRYPDGATISPDGSRVVFAGVNKPKDEQVFCHDGALFAVDAAGGPAEVLWRSQVPENGIVMYPTFSPDGTRIAFADGYCDYDHSVWVMNADGSDARKIFSPPGAGHVYGLAWSPAGDRIALDFVGGETVSGHMYTFAIDGSDLTDGADASGYCWPERRCSSTPGPFAP